LIVSDIHVSSDIIKRLLEGVPDAVKSQCMKW
jgi:hypothetical protein